MVKINVRKNGGTGTSQHPIRRSVAFQAYPDRSNIKANRPATLPQFYRGAGQDETNRKLCGIMWLS
jgi:hypothetical protein